MTLIEFGIFLLIAGVCGAIGQSLAGFSRGGCLTSVGLGLVGAMIGAWASRSLGLPEPFHIEVGGTAFPIVWSIVGSTLFVAVISALSRGSGKGRR